MDFKPLFRTIAKSFNPHAYDELVQRKFRHAIKYFFFIIALCILLMCILFIPVLLSAGNYVRNDLSHFGNFTVNTQFTLKEPFSIWSDPFIRLDTAQRNLTTERVLVTPDTISYRQYLFFGGQRDIPFINNVDVASSDNVRALIGLAIFFLLPSILFWGTIIAIIYFAVLILITAVFGMALLWAARHASRAMNTLKTAIYSSTIFIMLQLILMPFFRMFWIPLIAYWLLFIIVIFTTHEPVNAQTGKGKGVFEAHGHKDIFRNSNMEKRDRYDVDDRGNLKDSGASKKHFRADDDDGYVEL